MPPRLARVARALAALAALGLTAWAFSEDSVIGGGPGFGLTQRAVLLLGLVVGGSCFGPPAWSARLLALLLSTAATLVLAELSLRNVLAPRYYRPFEFDPRALYRLAPGAVREHRLSTDNGSRRVLYSVNRAGFRGEELDATHAALRIVVYGDSFIQGEFSELPNTFAERLEQHVAEHLGARVEVVNAGVAGYGTDQVLRRMEDSLADVQPDLVLVGIFAANDFGDLLRNKLYRLDGSGELRENPFVIDEAVRREMEIARTEPVLKVVLRRAGNAAFAALGAGRATGRSAGLETLESTESMTARERLDYFLTRHLAEYEENVVRGDSVVRELRWDVYDADISLTPRSDSARYKVALMDGVVAKIQQVAQHTAVPLALVVIPSPIDACGHESGEVDREKYPEYDPRTLTDTLERIALRHGIAFVNLFTPFQEHCADDLFLHGLDDHWNDRGQDFGAERVAAFLASSGLLDEAAHRSAQRRESQPD